MMGISPDRLAEIKRAAQERLTAAGHHDNKLIVSNGVIENAQIQSTVEVAVNGYLSEQQLVAQTNIQVDKNNENSLYEKQIEEVSISTKANGTNKTIQPTAFTAFDLISQRISDLQSALSSASPGYENHLIIIHKALQKDEECVHLLTEEQIGVIVAGLSKKKNIVINEAIVKKTRSSKSASKLTVEDL